MQTTTIIESPTVWTDTDRRKLSKQLNELDDEYVKPVEQYQFPVTTLSATTPAEAVCTIFETLNLVLVPKAVLLSDSAGHRREVVRRDARGVFHSRPHDEAQRRRR